MKTIILIELLINYILLILFNTHMLQLNSYFFGKHFHWMKKNLKKLFMQLFFIVISTVCIYFNNDILNIISIILLAISIIYNIPKKKSKISLKYTSRVKRAIFTDLLITLIVLIIGGIKNYLILKLLCLNIFANLLVVL